MKNLTHSIFCAILFIALHAVASSAIADSFSPYVDGKGKISFPENFDINMVHLGSWFVPDGGASGFHGVYTEKASVEAFRKNGKFPDGATLVKELRPSEAADYTTGKGVSHATTGIKQWFVMVKDSKGRFTSNPNWGDGWGWALFKADNTAANASADYKKDCLGCHVPVTDKDFVYTEGYPLLFK